MIDLIRWQFPQARAYKKFGESLNKLYLNLDQLLETHRDPIDSAEALRICSRMVRPLVKTHALPDFAPWSRKHQRWLDWLATGSFIYVIRDGPQVMTSYQQLAMEVDRETPEDMLEFMRGKQSYFLPERTIGPNQPRIWANHIKAWVAVPGVRCLLFSEIIRKPEQTVSELSALSGLESGNREPTLPPRSGGMWHGRVARLMSRCPSSTAVLTQTLCHRRFEARSVFDEAAAGFLASEAAELPDLVEGLSVEV